VSFVAINLCVASQRVFIVVIVYFVMTQSGNFWIHPDMFISRLILAIKHATYSLNSLNLNLIVV
jgi:hypothetical protein